MEKSVSRFSSYSWVVEKYFNHWAIYAVGFDGWGLVASHIRDKETADYIVSLNNFMLSFDEGEKILIDREDMD